MKSSFMACDYAMRSVALTGELLGCSTLLGGRGGICGAAACFSSSYGMLGRPEGGTKNGC